MKRILITGTNGYIGTHLQQYLEAWPVQYAPVRISVADASWKSWDFSAFDAVVHAAGLVHRRERPEDADLFTRVNRDLTAVLGEKAKGEGVGKFVFLSTMAVYGLDSGEITPQTQPAPTTLYGKSKLAGEQALEALRGPDFSVAILRLPMVYGRECPGNFRRLQHFVVSSPVFPDVPNQRSMISIANLCAFLRLILDGRCDGVFFPQNREYVSTTRLAELLAQGWGRPFRPSKAAGWAVRGAMPFVPAVRKAFGSLVYRDTEVFDFCYCTETLEESVAGGAASATKDGKAGDA